MAAYESLIAVAQATKQNEVVGLLRETQTEEAAADKFLTGIAKRLLKESGSASPKATKKAAPKSNPNPVIFRTPPQIRKKSARGPKNAEASRPACRVPAAKATSA